MRQFLKREQVVPHRGTTIHQAVSKELTWVGIGLVILVMFHLMVIAVLLLQREAVAESIKLAHPTFTGNRSPLPLP